MPANGTSGDGAGGRLIPVHDTELYIVERGADGAIPLIVLHGGPGLDHSMFGDYLDPLAEDGRYRLVLVDQRAQGRSARDAAVATWTLQQMASDVSAVAAMLGVDDYAVLGHSFGAFVALQHAVDAPGAAIATIVSGGAPSARYLDVVETNLAAFEPESLRDQVTDSWAREATVQTPEECLQILVDQMPFHFADPLDPRLDGFSAALGEGVYSPDVLRHFATAGYGGIEVEDQLAHVSQPLLACTGRHDRTCIPAASEAIAQRVPSGEMVIFEKSGHMTYVEENDRYLTVVRDFLDRAVAAGR